MTMKHYVFEASIAEHNRTEGFKPEVEFPCKQIDCCIRPAKLQQEENFICKLIMDMFDCGMADYYDIQDAYKYWACVRAIKDKHLCVDLRKAYFDLGIPTFTKKYSK